MKWCCKNPKTVYQKHMVGFKAWMPGCPSLSSALLHSITFRFIFFCLLFLESSVKEKFTVKLPFFWVMRLHPSGMKNSTLSKHWRKKSPGAATTAPKGSLHVPNGLACDCATPSALRVVFATVCLRLCVCLWLRRQSFQTGLSLTLVAHDRPPRCVFICVCVWPVDWHCVVCYLSTPACQFTLLRQKNPQLGGRADCIISPRQHTTLYQAGWENTDKKICPDEVKIEIKNLKRDTAALTVLCPSVWLKQVISLP